MSRMFWVLLVLASTGVGCAPELEGDDPGECTDRADNDADGLFDCDDSDCAGSPDCEPVTTTFTGTSTTSTGTSTTSTGTSTTSTGTSTTSTSTSTTSTSTSTTSTGTSTTSTGTSTTSTTGPTTSSLSSADYTFVGEGSGEYAGAVSSAGDVDGDGLDDILVGASENGDGGLSAGKAYLILGSSLGGLTEIDLRTADYTFVGENEGDIAGRRVSSAGDVDGDGLDDILIGAGGVEDGALNVGAAYLILGSSLGAIPEIDLSNADYHFVGQEGGTGDSLSSAGDVDGDGLDDILFGAPFFGGIGRAYLILGSSFGASPEMRLDQADYYFRGEQSGDDAGCSVASAGDVDGDGLDDILIGSQFYDDGGDSDAGKAYLIFGSSLAGKSQIDLFDADYIFAGEDDTDNAGSSVSSAGDVDGDGLDDILIGAPQADASVGKAYLVLGSSLGVSSEIDLYFADYWFMGEKGASIGYAGATVKSAGDVDGDGLSDILLGAKGGEYYPGKVYLVLGSSLGASSVMDLSTADYSLVGEEGGDAVGDHVSNAGDVDGDGLNDILVGATGNDDAGSNAGKAYLIFSHL